MKRLLSASALGRELGLTHPSILKMHNTGIIPAEIHEGRIIRFDADRVRKVLAKRAQSNRKTEANPTNMIPTY